ncbi:MAG: D-alanyl-D-alanine carboxypeptidase/D-alanyl-D-alanine-endopeptidase [Verrucomicrobiota bacterium]
MKPLLKTLLFLSGWAVAGWIFWYLRAPLPERSTDVERPGEAVASPYQAVFEKWAARPEFTAALMALVVLDEEGKPVFSSPLGETALCPASTLKTLTTGAAFGILGPEFRFETKLVHRADGNLALVGSGDPTLDPNDLQQLAAAAVSAGLKKVSGDLVADVSVFSSPPVNDHWNWGDIGNAYGAGAYGLNVGHNRMLVSFRPGAKPGDAAEFLMADPNPPDTRWESEVTTGEPGSGDGVTIYSTPGGRVISTFGTVPQGPAFTVGGALPDPPAVALATLRAALEKAGVKFSGKPVSREEAVVATHRSAPLAEIIDHLHEVSDNLEAQCLFLTIGNVSLTNPAAAVRGYWEKAGVAFEGLRLIDGSGLARANMIRPLDLARVNFAARRGPHGERYFESMNPSLGGNVRAKLGAMSGVKTDTGFLKMKNGREYTFALMANGLGTGFDFWELRAELLDDIRNVAE